MKGILKISLITMLAIVLLLGAMWLPSKLMPQYNDPNAWATTGNPGPTLTGYQMITIPISAITTTTSGIWKMKAPWPFKILHMSTVAQAVTGTCTVNLVNSAGTGLLTSAATLSTSVVDATLTATTANLSITDETNISLNTAGTGTADNVTVLMAIKRL